jgi:hypothetical protein
MGNDLLVRRVRRIFNSSPSARHHREEESLLCIVVRDGRVAGIVKETELSSASIRELLADEGMVDDVVELDCA